MEGNRGQGERPALGPGFLYEAATQELRSFIDNLAFITFQGIIGEEFYKVFGSRFSTKDFTSSVTTPPNQYINNDIVHEPNKLQDAL